MFDKAIDKAAGIIREGGVVAFPTETFYGLAVDPGQTSGLSRLIEIKQRDAAKGIPVIAASFADVERNFILPDALRDALESIWPAPLSVALTPREQVSRTLCGDFTSVAVRVSANRLARELAQRSGGLITATSANLSGQPPSQDAQGVMAQLKDTIDYLLDTGKTPGGEPSTIVAFEKGSLRIYRQGRYDVAKLTSLTGLSCLN
ncbi:MAG: threonylcarbamoyl-AMP synthase [Deltaproteobacteria bacterium]|jgi:L-threonylcarbamoyladenylate synthase|nr:threonylcarbamoyl-AMP synthase [Deltaproteobacteria bacterium]